MSSPGPGFTRLLLVYTGEARVNNFTPNLMKKAHRPEENRPDLAQPDKFGPCLIAQRVHSMESNSDQLPCNSLASIDGDPTPADSPVKERCFDQREALPGEPRCVICGRYGEYICDQTNDDICSVECKTILLSRRADTKKPEIKSKKPGTFPFMTSASMCSNLQGENTEQIASLRSKIDISVKGQSIPDLILSFSSCNLPAKLEHNLESAGYMQAIPAALSCRNLLVSAETGSGKTAAFLVPIISHCSQIRSQHATDRKNPLAMVLAPTRELCVQIEEQAKLLGKGLPFRTALVVGGEALAGQIYRIESCIELIVGTPGRLIDLLSKHNVELGGISVLVLDEVDCMLQKGFRDHVMQIFCALSSLRPNKSVKQIVIWVDPKQKKQKLFEILMSKQHFKPPTVVFVGSRLGADLLSQAITVATGLRALSFMGEDDE
ncbi:DEAD-box ATP-dependent RNA helicase 41 [Ananas comosus]|uniref:DEAD-box ATP-dependent RNA helicase 41 n=1 Tax=Ananas comosus TaxID=4615 RepID=A0A199V9F7_ANACO|nr:DEAD-box ATP-dependent RNA helicase 41 [Ananas comosus]